MENGERERNILQTKAQIKFEYKTRILIDNTVWFWFKFYFYAMSEENA